MRQLRDRLAPAALSAGVGLLGAGLLATGIVSGAQQRELPGTAVAAPHQAAAPAAPAAGSGSPAPTTTAPTTHPSRPQPPADHEQEHPAAQQPGTIRLASGGTARLVASHVTGDGTLAVPDGVREASYWGAGFGAESGATVVAGHVNWAGRTGPFAALWHARKGNEITVVDAGGHTFRFSVTTIVTLGKGELPEKAPTLFGQSGEHRLVLATCGGAWVGGKLGYASNRIVVATPES